jgi:hypothetical protein
MITNAPQEVYETMEELIEDKYPDLHSFGVTITAQMSQTNNGLKQHGYPVCIITKGTTEKDRAAPIKMRDVRILIDQTTWFFLSDEDKRGALDEALYAIDVQTEEVMISEEHPDKPGTFWSVRKHRAKLDECGRPKIKIRPCDIFIKGYTEVAERNGLHCVAVKQLAEISEDGQLQFPWHREPDRPRKEPVSVAASAPAISPAARESVRPAKGKSKAKPKGGKPGGGKGKAPKPNPAGEKVVEELLRDGSISQEA